MDSSVTIRQAVQFSVQSDVVRKQCCTNSRVIYLFFIYSCQFELKVAERNSDFNGNKLC